MPLKKGDFIEVEYTGKIKDDDTIFDTTDEKTAKDNDFHNPQMKFGPVVVVLGENHLLKGLDKQLEGKEVGEYSLDIQPEDAFGKKSADMIRLVPAKAFAKDDIKPFVGLEVGIDNMRGIVRSVSGGRILVDFNHPLASKELHYDIKVNKLVTEPKDKVMGLAEIFKVPVKNVIVEGDKAYTEYKQEVPEEATKSFAEEVKRLANLTIEKKKEVKEQPKEEKKEVKPEERKEEQKEEKPEEKKEEKSAETKEPDPNSMQ